MGLRYQGSKRRIAKYILPHVLKHRTNNQTIVEPFCGGCNFTECVDGPRIAMDINPYLISMWHSIVYKGWDPPSEVSEELYKDVKNNKELYDPALVGFIGFGCSFGGKWFGGYARSGPNSRSIRNYAKESRNNALKGKPKLIGVKFVCEDIFRSTFPKQSIVYCDPPYQGTTKYEGVFDSDLFFAKCIQLGDHIPVYISEYSAPPPFVCVWEKKIPVNLTAQGKYANNTEKLFTLPQWV